MPEHVASTDTRIVNRWWQLAACIGAMAAIANLQYAWTVFTLPLQESLGASRAAVQLAFTLFILAETWLVPVEGYLIDKLGARKVVSVGSILVAMGWVGSGYASSLTELYTWYTLGGVGAGAVYGASVGTALKWFPDKRGLATGLVAGAYGVATALTILPIQNMIASSGYRSAFIFWGFVQGVVVLVAAQFMLKPPPGWKPAGWSGMQAGSQVAQSSVSYTPGQMLKTGRFWILYFMMAMVAFGGLMVTAQLAPIASDYGLKDQIVWFNMSALSLALVLDRLMNGFTRPFWGWVSDYIGRYNTMAITFSLEAFGIWLLLQLGQHPIAFVILSGFVFFAWGNIYSLFPAAVADLFGSEYATTNYGLQYTAKGTASIFAGWGASALVQATGSWGPVLWVAVGCDVLAAALAFFWLRPLVARLALSKPAGAPQVKVRATATI